MSVDTCIWPLADDEGYSAATRIAASHLDRIANVKLTLLQVSLLGYVFSLTFLTRQKIGQQHRFAKVAVDALVAAFPTHWHDIRNYPAGGTTAVSERSILLSLVSPAFLLGPLALIPFSGPPST